MAIVIFIGCGGDQSSSSNEDITIAIKKSPERINPMIYPTSSAREVYQFIFVSLADYDPRKLQLEPVLIEQLPQVRLISEGQYKGAYAYDIRILDDASWEDGSPITGYDYAFTIKTIKLPSVKSTSYRSYIKAIEDVIVDKDDPKSFSVIIDEDYMIAKEAILSIPIYPRYFYDANDALSIVNIPSLNIKSSADSIASLSDLQSFSKSMNGLEYSRSHVQGAGPYTIESWQDQSIVLKRKENYWTVDPEADVLIANPERIIFHIIPDEAALMTQLKEGSIDVTKYLSADGFAELQNKEAYQDEFDFLTPEIFQYFFIGINNSSPKLSNNKVRRAMAHLTDVDEMIRILEGGHARRTTGIIHPNKSYYNQDLVPVPFDTVMAANMLEEARWIDSNGNGIRDKMVDGKKVEMILDFYITGSELGKNIALFFKEDAKKAGVDVNIITKPMKRMRPENLKTRKYDMAALGVPQDIGLDDPYNKWHSDNDQPTRSNDYSYRSSVADGLIDHIRQAKDEETRTQYYRKLQEVMHEDQASIFLYNPTERIVVNKKWKGYGTSKRPGYLANTFISSGK